MRGVTYSKLVFLDSQDGVRGAKALRPTFTVPSNDFSVGNEESIRLRGEPRRFLISKP